MKINRLLVFLLIILFTASVNAQIKYNKGIPSEAHQKITQYLPGGISGFSFSPNGGWVIISKNNNFHARNIPNDCYLLMKQYRSQGAKLEQVSFVPKIANAHVVITNKGAYGVKLPNDCSNKIGDFQKRGKRIKSISFPYKASSSNSWVIITTSGEFFAKGIPTECYNILKKVREANRTGKSSVKLTQVSFTPSGGWVVLADDQFFAKGIPNDAYQQLKSFKAKKYTSDIISFTPNGKGWSLIANEKFSKASKDVFNKTTTSASITSGTSVSHSAPVDKKYILRITLENFECVESDDSDDKDDYVFNQWIEYTNKNGNRISSTDAHMNINASNSIDKKWTGQNLTNKDIIFKGDGKHQFWVEEETKKAIGNYIVFEITAELLDDSYSKFIIRNHLIEYSGDGWVFNVKWPAHPMAGNNAKVNVDIRRVVKDLINIKNVTAGKWTYYDKMRLRKYNNSATDLYGYIDFKTGDGERKARAKMRFKLID